MNKITFEKRTDSSKQIKDAVDRYFHENKISKKGNFLLYCKTIIWLTLWPLLYVVIMISSPGYGSIVLVCLFALTSAFIGFNIMHDAIHGAYSKNKIVNTLLGKSLNLIGPLPFLWAVKHNILHHTNVNTDLDDDIVTGNLIRMSPNQKHAWYHAYQHYYAPLLYGLLAFQWIYIADLKKMLTKKVHVKVIEVSKSNYSEFWITKGIHILFFWVIPISIHGWKITCLGVAIYLFVVGVFISIIFQLAHVQEMAKFSKPGTDGKFSFDFVTHQLNESVDFATNNKLITWLLGGLNFQTIHHLFPEISHVHYPTIQKIVREKCKALGLTYNHIPTFFGAIKAHFLYLKKLGNLKVSAPDETMLY